MLHSVKCNGYMNAVFYNELQAKQNNLTFAT
jgi:hypothetical protein